MGRLDRHQQARPRCRKRSLPMTRRRGPTRPNAPIVRDAADGRRRATRASSGDVTGAWSATTRVDSASVDRYKGLRLGYRLNLQQSGNQITGTGFKTAENGRALKAKARTPITLEGTTNGRDLRLTFTEQGLRRASTGQFVMTIANDGTLRGRFDSDAARSRGTVEARRRQ